MKIAILGTRGIPNYYGGFEQCAEYLALGLVKRGYEVVVYNSHNHPYQESTWNGVTLNHQYDPEHKLGTIGQFIYDLNCILDLKKQKADIILQLGYTSSSIWGWMMPKDAIVTTNMDGLEWKRTKYSGRVRKFLLMAERLGVKYSDHLISDSIGIQDYLKEKYDAESDFIPYGANVFEDPEARILADYNLQPYDYDLLIARLEPENSIEVILDGVAMAMTKRPFLVIGNHNTDYGNYLKTKFKRFHTISFVGGIYDINVLNNLRYYSNVYFHGHTVGGTNPSLLEAMASNALICANNNSFNKYILGEDALYFNTQDEVYRILLETDKCEERFQSYINNNTQKITDIYTWDRITEQYVEHFERIAALKYLGSADSLNFEKK
jgi:glycosyltransferase involved in cell wall biosynthesis